MGPSPGTEPGNKTRGPMEPGIGTGFGKRPESVPTEPGTGPGANRSPYPPDESPRADAGPSVRNPHAASLTPASAGVFRNESRPNAPQTSQKPSHPPRRRKIAPPSDPGKTHPTPGKPVRAPGSPCPPGIADPFSRTRPLRPPEKRKPAPHPANHSGPSTPPFAIHRPHPHRGTALRRTPMPHRSGTPPTAPSPSQQRLTCAGEPPGRERPRRVGRPAGGPLRQRRRACAGQPLPGCLHPPPRPQPPHHGPPAARHAGGHRLLVPLRPGPDASAGAQPRRHPRRSGQPLPLAPPKPTPRQ